MSRRITRREFLTRSSLAGAGALLASRAPSVFANPLAGTARRQFTKTELTVPSWWAPHEIAGAEAAFAEYFTPETGITVKYEFIGADFNTKIFTNLTSGEPYDVITFNADSVPPYLARGVLMPIDDLAARDNLDLDDFDPKAIEQWTHDGKLYGLTNDMGSFHCYFNLDLFEEAGITPPKSTEEWTWDQLREWAQALTKKEGDQIVQYGFAAVDTQWAWETWPNLNGAFVFDEGLTQSLLGDPLVIEAFQFYQDLMYVDNSALRPGAIQVGANDLFIAGQLAILLDGTWQVGYLRSKKDEVKFRWDVGLLPHNASATEYYIPNFTGGWVLPAVAQDVDASWEAMKFYASKTFAEEVMFVTLSSLPTRKSALEGGKFYQWPDNPPEGITPEFYGILLEQGRSRRHLKFDLGSEVGASMSKLDLIYSNEQKPGDLLPGLAEEVTAALSQRPWNM